MGNSEDGKSCKPEKPSSPATDQANIHVYPDWAAMQAYYGPRLAVPPYFNSSMASGHAPPPYIWGAPQPMISPYGTPYAAIYAHPHGGVYAHPGVPMGSSPGHGVPSSPAVGEAIAISPLNVDPPTKLSGNADRGLMKKLKGFDGLAMSIGNTNTGCADGEAEHGLSQSSGETDGSSVGSEGNTRRASQNGRKTSREESSNNAGDGKIETGRSAVPPGEVNGPSEKVMGLPVSAVTGKAVGTVLSPNMTTALELGNPSNANVKPSPTSVPQPGPMMPNEAWVQNERELKRERRKQSNRESARRSRLRKQAETEEQAMRVESLNSENMTLKSEIKRLTENSGKLKLENAILMEKLKTAHQGRSEGLTLDVFDEKKAPISTENLLSRVNNNAGFVDRSDEVGEMCEKNSGTKLRQLLDASPRTDAVAAG